MVVLIPILNNGTKRGLNCGPLKHQSPALSYQPWTKLIFFLLQSVPDITRHDGIYSQYLTKMNQVGFYSARYQSRIGLDTWRHWIGPSFYVSVPIEPGIDNIPPSR